MDSKAYWDGKIIEWENSMQGQGRVGLVEKVGSYFRGPVKFRKELCLNMLAPLIQGKRILDLGCGSGFFAFELYERAKPAQITGIDISPAAINRAQDIARNKNLSDRLQFVCGDINTMTLPEADITVGLGFFDYLTLAEIANVFQKMKSSQFLFSFVERKVSLMRYIHILYLATQRCPKHFYYTKEEIQANITAYRSDAIFMNDPRLSFACLIHHLEL